MGDGEEEQVTAIEPAGADAVDAAVEEADTAVAPARRERPTPWLLLAAVTVVVVPLQVALRPLIDIDLYWHLLIGQEILGGTPVAEAARGWSYAPVPDTWITTQWLAEVLFAKLYELGGFNALILYRALTALAALAVLGLVTLRGRPARAAVWPFALGGVAVAMASQERSQQLTYVLAPLVGWWALRLWREGRLPRWWAALPLVVVWANFHGGWLILPMALVIAAVARAIDHGLRDRAAWLAVGLAALCFPAAAISPAGLDNAFAFLRFSSATVSIAEWKHVIVWDWQGISLTLTALLVVVAWARGRARPTWGEVVLVLTLLAFGYQAWRSIAPTVLMLAPIVAGILARALGEPDPREGTAPQPMHRVLVGAWIVAAVLAPVLALTSPESEQPGIPVDAISTLADAPGPLRVLNTYNLSGPILWYGGGPGHLQLGVDGRADRYGAEWIQRYTEDLPNVAPGWEELLAELSPDVAVLSTTEPLSQVLVAQKGWVEVARDDEAETVVLRAPTTPAWTDEG